MDLHLREHLANYKYDELHSESAYNTIALVIYKITLEDLDFTGEKQVRALATEEQTLRKNSGEAPPNASGPRKTSERYTDVSFDTWDPSVYYHVAFGTEVVGMRYHDVKLYCVECQRETTSKKFVSPGKPICAKCITPGPSVYFPKEICKDFPPNKCRHYHKEKIGSGYGNMEFKCYDCGLHWSRAVQSVCVHIACTNYGNEDEALVCCDCGLQIIKSKNPRPIAKIA